jgi:hypothetical protein
MTVPVPWYRKAYGVITGIFGNEDFAYRCRIELIEALERALQQIEATATGHYERYVALIGEVHSSLDNIT